MKKLLLRLQGYWFMYVHIELKHGEFIPTGYGWAGYNEVSDRVFVMPLGLNLIYSGLMWMYYAMLQGVQSREQSYTYKTARQLGEVAGYQVGYMRGYVDGKNGKPNQLTQIQEGRTDAQ